MSQSYDNKPVSIQHRNNIHHDMGIPHNYEPVSHDFSFLRHLSLKRNHSLFLCNKSYRQHKRQSNQSCYQKELLRQLLLVRDFLFL